MLIEKLYAGDLSIFSLSAKLTLLNPALAFWGRKSPNDIFQTPLPDYILIRFLIRF